MDRSQLILEQLLKVAMRTVLCRYWLMCAGDQLFACNTSIVGSIGVITGSFGATGKPRTLTS